MSHTAFVGVGDGGDGGERENGGGGGGGGPHLAQHPELVRM